jgi:hypothetical protein
MERLTTGIGANSYQFPDPYSGNCDNYNLGFNWPVSFKSTITYYAVPNSTYPDSNGHCFYQYDACEEGVPSCQPNPYPYQYSAGCAGQCTPCPQYVYQKYWAVSINGYSPLCVPTSYGAGGPGTCT